MDYTRTNRFVNAENSTVEIIFLRIILCMLHESGSCASEGFRKKLSFLKSR